MFWAKNRGVLDTLLALIPGPHAQSTPSQLYLVSKQASQALQELLAVIGALKHRRDYLEGADFTIVTDHKPNVTFDTKSAEHLSSRQIRWGQFLANFEYKCWSGEKELLMWQTP